MREDAEFYAAVDAAAEYLARNHDPVDDPRLDIATAAGELVWRGVRWRHDDAADAKEILTATILQQLVLWDWVLVARDDSLWWADNLDAPRSAIQRLRQKYRKRW